VVNAKEKALKDKRKALEQLVLQDPLAFIPKYGDGANFTLDPFDGKGKAPKIVSVDDFKQVTYALKRFYEDRDQPMVVGNVGGSDALLSLYANLRMASYYTETFPHLLAVDRNPYTLQTLMFKILLKELDNPLVLSKPKKETKDGLLTIEGPVSSAPSDVPSAYAATSPAPSDLLDILPETASLTHSADAKKADEPMDELEELTWDEDQNALAKDHKAQFLGNLIDFDMMLYDKKTFEPKGIRSIGSKRTFAGVINQALGNDYVPEKHLENLIKKAEMDANFTPAEKDLFIKLAGNFTQRVADVGYETFLKRLRNNVLENWGYHYLSTVRGIEHPDALFMNFRDITTKDEGGKAKSHIHLLDIDLSTQKGVKALDAFLNDTNLQHPRTRPIDVAYIPHLKKMPAANNYMRDNALHTISATLKPGVKKRSWSVQESNDLPIVETVAPVLKNFLPKSPTEKPIAPFSLDNPQGLPKTLFLAGLNIGYMYADADAVRKVIDLSNQSKVEHVVMGGGAYGPHLFTENRRRDLGDTRFRFLGDQLRELRKVFDGFEAPVTYIMTDNDLRTCEDLFNTYFFEKNRRRGDMRIARTAAGGLLLDRAAYDAVNDKAFNIIRKRLYPTMIRAGKDLTQTFEDRDERSLIVELIDAIDRYDRLGEKGLLFEDLDVLPDLKYLKDSVDLRVVHEYASAPGEDGTGIRAFGSTQFGDSSQPSKPTRTLDEFVKLTANGTVDIPQQILVDMRSAYQYMKADSGKLKVFVPDMSDDRKYFENDISRRTKSDPVHKRMTLRKSPNLPGSWFMAGDLDYQFSFKPIFPKVLEIMDGVQKSGQGYTPTRFAFIQDVQVGSITENLELQTKFMDYAFHERGCIGAFGVGDLLHGNNYPDFKNESRSLGGVDLESQQRATVWMQMPYFTLPHVAFWNVVEGNHEWNTDRSASGINYLTPLQTAIYAHSFTDPNHKVEAIFPSYIITNAEGKGQIVRARYGAKPIGPWNFMFGHKWSERGGQSKGSASNAATHISSWFRNMGDHAEPFDIFIGGHYHGLEAHVMDDKIGIIAPSFAGESGYEFARQFSGNRPMGLIGEIAADGSIGFELITDKFLDAYNVQNPFVKEKGLDRFLQECVNVEVQIVGKPIEGMQKSYVRGVTPVTAKTHELGKK
jgi:hypothetical protein